jgi:VIT family
MRPMRRFLDRYTLIAEVLFGLIMVLTFTGSLSVADAGRDDVRAMLIGALGCNLAWGIIDGIFYLMDCVSEQGQGIRSLRALRKVKGPEEARQVIVDSLPPVVAATITPAEYENIHQRLLQLPAPPSRPHLGKREWLAALSVFFWVFVTTFPVAIPFIFMDNLMRAMRVSNAIAIALLFVAGFAFARIAEYRPWLTGIAMVIIGCMVVAATIALGG